MAKLALEKKIEVLFTVSCISVALDKLADSILFDFAIEYWGVDVLFSFFSLSI